MDVACTPASGSTFSEGSTTVSCTATDDSGNSATVVFDIDILVYDSTIFRDGFDGSIGDSWTNNNQDSFWSTNYNVPVTVPGHDSANKIAQASLCNFPGGCVMELTDGLDLFNHTDPEFLEFYRYVDDELDDTEYLKLEAYDGTVWTELDRWSPENSDNDGAWHLEEYALSDYTGSTDFKVRFTAVSSASLDEFGIDDIRVFKDPYRTQPAVTAPADIVAEATSQYTILDIGSATATDDTDSSPTITNDAPASFPLGTTTVTWTATDSDGNSSTDTQTVTVRDTTPPAITPPPNAPFGTSGTSLSLTESDYGTATATDLVDQTPAITNNAPASFPIGATVITWTATDDSLNSAAANQTVVVAGSVPVIAAPADLTVEATGSLTVADIGNATAADGTDPDPAIANDAPASFPLGRTVVTWTVTDSEGNFSTDIQTVTVQDTTAPVMGPVQNQAFSFAPGETLAVNYAMPTATDMVDASVEINCNPASGSVFAQGVTLVTCLATDDHDNFVTATFNVNVAVSAPVVGSTLFLDDFEDGDLIGWDVPGFFLTWRADAFDDSAVPPGHNSTNKVAEADWCDAECTMTMVAGIDLTGQANATLQFYRYVDVGLDSNEYLKVEAYNGTAWAQLDIWTPENGDDDDAWHLEEYSLSGYSGVADFKVRFAAFMSSHIEDVAIDDVKVFVRP